MRFLIGIDEAGRAPLAGPVSVGAVLVPRGFDVAREFPGVKDSKQLSAKKREEIYALLEKRQEAGDVRFCVRFSDHVRIDEIGITRSVRRAINNCVYYLTRATQRGTLHAEGSPLSSEIYVQLDGLLYAPRQYSQETIINGDELVPLISLASIAAKVERDRLMYRMAKKYPAYGFERHVGYATQFHRDAIKAHGLCDIHRVSFCKNVVGVR